MSATERPQWTEARVDQLLSRVFRSPQFAFPKTDAAADPASAAAVAEAASPPCPRSVGVTQATPASRSASPSANQLRPGVSGQVRTTPVPAGRARLAVITSGVALILVALVAQFPAEADRELIASRWTGPLPVDPSALEIAVAEADLSEASDSLSAETIDEPVPEQAAEVETAEAVSDSTST